MNICIFWSHQFAHVSASVCHPKDVKDLASHVVPSAPFRSLPLHYRSLKARPWGCSRRFLGKNFASQIMTCAVYVLESFGCECCVNGDVGVLDLQYVLMAGKHRKASSGNSILWQSGSEMQWELSLSLDSYNRRAEARRRREEATRTRQSLS